MCNDYVTEKLWRTLIVGSVPVYFGAPNVKVSALHFFLLMCVQIPTDLKFKVFKKCVEFVRFKLRLKDFSALL